MGRRIVCGDIHGAHLALEQCFERSNFNFDEDELIQIGDICDGWAYVYECVEMLLKVKKLIQIKGNHDDWFIDFIKHNFHPQLWNQGGEGTLKSYCRHLDKLIDKSSSDIKGKTIWGWKTNMLNTDLPQTHVDFFLNMKLYYRDWKNNFFVHGGFDRHNYIDYLTVTDPTNFYWDRKLWEAACSFSEYQGSKLKMAEDFREVFIGHTATVNWKTDLPMHKANVWNVDTGAGFAGKLTFMDVDTKEIWQSDLVKELYPNEHGR